ncbi:MAG: MFS transporter [Dehalococcoidia bacterium]
MLSRGPAGRYARRTFESLGTRDFAILLTGTLFAFTAFFMSTVVASIVAFDLTGRNGAVGLVLLGQGLAMAMLGPVGGAVADRAPKRLVTGLCQVGAGTVFFVTAVLVVTDAIAVWHLVAGSFVIGTMFAFMGPARQAWSVELVSDRLRPNAVALTQVALNASRVVAPAVAGFLAGLAMFGPGGAYFVMSGLYAIAVGSLLFLPGTTAREGPARSVFRDLAAGVRYVAGEPRLRAMMILFFSMIVLGLSATAAVLPGFVEHELDRDVTTIGPLMAVSAVGGLAVSLAVAPMADSSRALAIYGTMALIMGASLTLMGTLPELTVSFVAMFIYGVGSGGFQTLNMAVVVSECAPEYYGRVTSLTMLAFAGFMLAGFPIGVLADTIGEASTLMVLGTVIVGIVLVLAPIIARAPSSRSRRQREARYAAPAESGVG